RKQLRIKAGKRQKKGEIVLVVVASKRKGDEDQAFYGWFQEAGWNPKMPGTRRAHVRKTGDTAFKVEGKHYMQRAYETRGDEAAKIAEDQIIQAIDQAATGK